jgi:adenosylcobinamide-GDP ribazoletransferase
MFTGLRNRFRGRIPNSQPTPLNELATAFMLLTRLPLGRLVVTVPAAGADLWAYPIVGAVVGFIGGLAFWAAHRLGLPPSVAAICAIAGSVLATGALHEDGLADTADGFGGGATRARKLEIMRDSRIGTFGAVALVLSLALRVAALAALADPGRVAVALIAAGMLGRGAMIGVMLALRPARPDGMAAALGPVRIGPAVVGLGIAGACVLLSHGVHALLGAVLAGALMVCLARRQIGGYTGDILGATEQAAECAVLVAMLMR